MNHWKEPVTLSTTAGILWAGAASCFALLAATCILLAPASSVRAADVDPSATSGREAFEHGNFPWYDVEHDALRPIKIKPRPPERKPLKLPDWTSNVFWVLVALVLAVLVVVLVLMFRDSRGLRRRPAGDEGEPMLDAARIEALPFMAERPRGDLLAEARRHYAAGNYSEAIIYLFSYELVQLDKSALVRLMRGKTNRQYLRELGTSQSLRQPLEQTMTAFESVFFGRRPLGKAAFEACWQRLADFESLSIGGAT